jgi:aminoacyl-tRNA hydrolase
MFLPRTVFIGITGSSGKTTTKELIAAILSKQLRGQKSPQTCNTPYHVARQVLRTRTHDNFSAIEVSAIDLGRPVMDIVLELFEPRISVVTNIAADHLDCFGSVEAIAAEKGKLVAALPANGTAVLNADDPHVIAMRNKCAGRVITYGLAPDAAFRAENIRSNWPNRLSFTALCDNKKVQIETQLCGSHLIHNVLAALAVGHVMGIPLASAADAIRDIRPVGGRMSPVPISNGVTFIRDDWKATLSAIPSVLEFMQQATAERKIVILGTISDYQGQADLKYLAVAKQALAVADVVLSVGPWSSRCLRARRHPDDDAVRAFATVEQLSKFLRGFLKAGDLVLVKGSGPADRLQRIVTAYQEHIEKSVVPMDATLPSHSTTDSVHQRHTENGICDNRFNQIIIGLGNPHRRYQHTPHNVGYAALEVLAQLIQAQWSDEVDFTLARGQYKNQMLWLMKPKAEMNNIGPLVAKLAERLGFSHSNCLIVYDDLDLDLGAVKQRMRGSAGGHKGMQSIIIAFQSESFRRVKIGVGRPPRGKAIADYVLTPFDQSQRTVIDKACREAADRVLQMVEAYTKEAAKCEPQQVT